MTRSFWIPEAALFAGLALSAIACDSPEEVGVAQEDLFLTSVQLVSATSGPIVSSISHGRAVSEMTLLSPIRFTMWTRMLFRRLQ